jgi:hypothetical protein
MNFFFLPHDITHRGFVLTIDLSSPKHTIFPLMSRIFTFSPKGSTLGLGKFELPGSLLWHFEALFSKLDKSYLNTNTVTLQWPFDNWDGYQVTDIQWIWLTRGWLTSQAGQAGWLEIHHTTIMALNLNHTLLISGIFHLIFLDCSWPRLTETKENRTIHKGRLLCISRSDTD